MNMENAGTSSEDRYISKIELEKISMHAFALAGSHG